LTVANVLISTQINISCPCVYLFIKLPCNKLKNVQFSGCYCKMNRFRVMQDTFSSHHGLFCWITVHYPCMFCLWLSLCICALWYLLHSMLSVLYSRHYHVLLNIIGFGWKPLQIEISKMSPSDVCPPCSSSTFFLSPQSMKQQLFRIDRFIQRAPRSRFGL
jgi:hypothetical protein